MKNSLADKPEFVHWNFRQTWNQTDQHSPSLLCMTDIPGLCARTIGHW